MTTMPTATRTVSQLIAAQLADLSVRTVFSLMGEDTAALVTTLSTEHECDVYATRHEAAAVMAADSFAWATGALGVAILSHGPGFTNGLTAAISAVRAERMLLVIAGHDAHESVMKPDLKRSDQAGFARAAGLSACVAQDSQSVESALSRAVSEARAGRPALLSVPVDVLNGPASETPSVSEPRDDPQPAACPQASEIDQLVAWIGRSSRPLLLAGGGALGAGTQLEALGDRTGALLGTTLVGRGLFHGHRLDIGLVGGWAGDAARPLLDEVDLVIAFGASLNSFTPGVRKSVHAGENRAD